MMNRPYEASPKEVAVQLVSEMIESTIGLPTITNKQAKACAVIAAREIGINGNNENNIFFGRVIEEIKAL